MEKKRPEGYKRYLDKTSKESVPKRTLIRRKKTHLSQRVVKSYSDIKRNDSDPQQVINFNSLENRQDAADSIIHVDEHSDDEVSRTDNGAVHNKISSSSSEIDSDCYDELLHTPSDFDSEEQMYSVCGLGRKNQYLMFFLKPFTEQAFRLATKGLNIHVKGKLINVKVLPACCCADSVARPCLQNSTQYNGFYGCSWCIHPGFTVDGTVKYCIRNTLLYKERTELDTAELVVEAIKSGKSKFGIKGPSPLVTIPHFNVVQGFSLDSMHSIFLGVTKKIVCLWFDTTNSGKDYYLGSPKSVHEVNERMSSIIMSQCVGRVPRLIFKRKLYKASEWRNFLLYVCLPVLTDLLPKKYSEHISCLIGGVFLLLKKSLSMQELQKVDKFFLKFVVEAQDLYGEHFMAFNVHSLLHVTQSVLD
nr:uncharacterized protein LOC122271298 [Parasteatoda tepidariorum]